ncbi:MAG: divergent polysaccharide deacetylase family protein [Thermodesulfobacteriota bacterium]
MDRSRGGEKGRRRKRWGWAALVTGAFAAGLLLFAAVLYWPTGGNAPAPKTPPFAGRSPEPAPPSGEPAVPAERSPRLAIVVGDFGYEPVRDAEWLDFPGRITFAVLPFGPSSRTIASSAHSRGLGVILHVPMEPRTDSPDRTEPFRLLLGMTPGEIRDRLGRMTEDVPQAAGAINHMGSAFTADAAAMEAFASALRERGMFFVDGVTTSGSLAAEACRNVGVPALRRDVFLDDSPDPGAMRKAWEKAVAIAKERGDAVLVSHSRRETLTALLSLVPDLEREGVRTATVAELLADRSGAALPTKD